MIDKASILYDADKGWEADDYNRPLPHDLEHFDSCYFKTKIFPIAFVNFHTLWERFFL